MLTKRHLLQRIEIHHQEIEELKIQIWKLQHPFKFKKGEKVTFEVTFGPRPPQIVTIVETFFAPKGAHTLNGHTMYFGNNYQVIGENLNVFWTNESQLSPIKKQTNGTKKRSS